MSSTMYDLDTSGGLMEQIQALIAPPMSEDEARRSKKQMRERPRYRPGKVPNHDYCDSCKEGGDLICCDRCSASFHLLCHDPPLTEDDLPTGEWVCHRCKTAPKQEDDTLSTCSSTSRSSSRSRAKDKNGNNQPLDDLFSSSQERNKLLENNSQIKNKLSDKIVNSVEVKPVPKRGRPPKKKKDVPEKSDTKGHEKTNGTVQEKQEKEKAEKKSPEIENAKVEKKESRDRRSKERVSKRIAALHREKLQKEEHQEQKEIVASDDYDGDDNDSPLSVLIQAAERLNPKEFELPGRIKCTMQIPGTYKWSDSNNGRPKKVPHERDNMGLVPLPAKLCFKCNQSCRVAPLLQCDFCPLLFHLDCLDPPLTSPPTERWMCPNHPEHAVDAHLLKCTKLSERVKLWEQFCGRVNQHTVKVNFLKKVHRKNPPFRYKFIRKVHNRTVKVPDAIKNQYNNPPPMLPSSWNLSASDTLLNVLDEQEQWLASVVQLQCGVARHLAKKQMLESKGNIEKTSPQSSTSSSSVDTSVTAKSDTPLTSDLDGAKQSLVNGSILSSDENEKLGNGPILSESVNMKSESVLEYSSLHNLSDATSVDGKLSVDLASKGNGQTVSSSQNRMLNCVWSKTSPGFSNAISGPAHHQSVVSDQSRTTNFQKESSGTSLTLGQANSDVSKLKSEIQIDPSSPAILTLNNQLEAFIEGNDNSQMDKLDDQLVQVLAWQRLQQLLPEHTGVSSNGNVAPLFTDSGKVKARAVLCPLAGNGPAHPMPYRKLSIGTGSDMDLCLANYGQCCCNSSKHACIFYDEFTKHYELLNYSEHGTTVDNVFYSCDISEKPASVLYGSPVVQTVRQIIKKGRKRKIIEEEKGKEEPKTKPVMMKAPSSQKIGSCQCVGRSTLGGNEAGWEGTALLHHGSVIRCGCLQFVFSITDCATNIIDTQPLRQLAGLAKNVSVSRCSQ